MKNRYLAVTVGLLFAISAAAAETTPPATPARPLVCSIDNSFWQTPRSGAAVLANQALRPCVNALLETPGSLLLITAPDTDDASIQANELRQWLLALALPANRVRIQTGSGNPNLQLELQHD